MSRLDDIRQRDAGYVHSAIDELEQAAEDRRWLLSQVDRLREALRDTAEAYHQAGSLRDHADPNDRTGWHVHGIETCEDVLCLETLAALEADDDA